MPIPAIITARRVGKETCSAFCRRSDARRFPAAARPLTGRGFFCAGESPMVRIALPNKGRLATETRDLLERAGLAFEASSERALQASLGGEFVALFVRAQDIPEFVADGAADLGITGLDLIVESGREVLDVLDLGCGRCRVVIAVREDSDIEDMSDVPAGARVATVFPSMARACFAARQCDVTIVPVSGAAEIAPHLGVA